jgi:hypothetical protein
LLEVKVPINFLGTVGLATQAWTVRKPHCTKEVKTFTILAATH